MRALALLAALFAGLLPMMPASQARPARAHARAQPAKTAESGAPHAASARPAWILSHFPYSTDGATVDEALAELSAMSHVTVATDAPLGARIEGRFDLPPQRFLEMLARNYDLDWYYDGSVLHVGPTSARRTLTLRLNYAKPAALRALLVRSGAADVRFPLAVRPGEDAVTVTGPPAYVELVASAAARIDRSARADVPTAVRVVALRHGVAADRVALANDRHNVADGVATRARRQLAPPDAAIAGVIEYETPLPVIVADARTNSVLIRDRAERLDADARVIAALDVSADAVAVDTLIADVDAAAVPSLPFGVPQADPDAAAGSAHVRVDDAGAALRRRVEQLCVQRRARVVLDRPLLTSDGVAAALEERAGRSLQRTGHAAQDELDTPLAGGAAPGFALRVLPSIADGGAARTVALAAEWRARSDVHIVRIALAPSQGVVMVEPGDAEGAAQIRLVMLVPRVLDGP